MRPEQIQELLHAMNVPKMAHTNPSENQAGDGSGDEGVRDGNPP